MKLRALMLCVVLYGCGADPALKELVWHTSAEYAALCIQTFNSALRVLDSAERRGKLPPAIVMDLDETVLDTLDFQLKLARGDIEFDSQNWSRWVHSDRAGLVPGVKRFITEVRKRNIQVVFLSNRSAADTDASLVTLRRLGVVPREHRPEMFLREQDASKEGRRRAVEKKYEVLAYFGDNLADLAQDFEADTLEARYAALCNSRDRFGMRWFVLPNPMYGGWQKPTAKRDLGAPRPTCD